ncbi:MAG: ABC transporter substrate-binding protein [Microvirga sp.]|nr:ABC transporter substrate-binding protein [Microvirga sp.]
MAVFGETTRRGLGKLVAGGLVAASFANAPFAFAADGPLVIGGLAEDASLDPNGTNAADWIGLLLNVYDTVITRGADGALAPGLATEWSQVDELTWELTLREGVRFHSGDAFSAADVAYTYNRVLNPDTQSPQRSYLSAIASVEAEGESLVRITLSRPEPLLLQNLLLVPIVRDGATQQDLARAANGTGPYKLDGWTPGDQLVISSADGYWGETPAIERVIFRSFPESNSLISALQAGEVDVAVNMQPDIALALRGSGDFDIISAETERSIFIVLDNMAEPLDDPRVRRAVNLAIDRDALANDVMLGNATPIGNIVGDMYLGTDPALKPVYDPEAARALLAEAGHPDGVSFKMFAPSGRYLKDREIAEAIVGQLSRVGIRVDLELMEFGNMMTRYRAHELSPAYLIGFGLPILDSGRPLQSYFLPGSVQSYYRDEEIEAAINEAIQIADLDEREAALKEINRTLFERDAFVYLYLQKTIYGVSNRISWTPRTDERIRIMDFKYSA